LVDGGVTGEDVDVVAVVPLWVGTVGEAPALQQTVRSLASAWT